MRWFLLLLVTMGALYWWQHREPTAAVEPTTSAAAVVDTPVPPVAPATGNSWPKRNLDQAQGALDAVKKQREEL